MWSIMYKEYSHISIFNALLRSFSLHIGKYLLTFWRILLILFVSSQSTSGQWVIISSSIRSQVGCTLTALGVAPIWIIFYHFIEMFFKLWPILIFFRWLLLSIDKKKTSTWCCFFSIQNYGAFRLKFLYKRNILWRWWQLSVLLNI